jgi:hypothetical protein
MDINLFRVLSKTQDTRIHGGNIVEADLPCKRVFNHGRFKRRLPIYRLACTENLADMTGKQP